MGRVKRCKGFFRKLTLGTDAAYAEGHPLARRPIRTCWNPDGFNARIHPRHDIPDRAIPAHLVKPPRILYIT